MRKSLQSILSIVILSFILIHSVDGQAKFDFQNTKLSIDKRVDDLIDRMTLEEKAGQLLFDSPAIDRLDVPAYNWWNECLHGVARNGRATNANRKVGYVSRYSGLTFWSPNVNLFRDPRWGRGQETYGEDPHLISRLGVSFVNALQGDDPNHMKVAAMAKHYAVHSGPEKLRHVFDAVVSRNDLWNTYLPAFEALVTEANVEGVMGA